MLFVSLTSFAQLPEEGVLTYEVDTVRRLNPEAGKMRLESLVITYKDGGKLCKIEAGYPEYLHSDASQTILCLNNETFMVFRLPEDSLTILQLPAADPTNTDYESIRTQETKIIDALKCQKWVLTHKKMDWTFDAWVLEQPDIQIPLGRYFTQFLNVHGLPVELDMEMNGWVLHLKLEKIETLLKDSLISLPKGKTTSLDTFLQEWQRH